MRLQLFYPVRGREKRGRKGGGAKRERVSEVERARARACVRRCQTRPVHARKRIVNGAKGMFQWTDMQEVDVNVKRDLG